MSVRVGFVGVGARAVGEMIDLTGIPGVEITALCDVEPERCQQAVASVAQRLGPEKAPSGARQFADVRDMLGAVDVDAVYVSLPPFAHGDVERAVLEAGKAICVEKPVALTMDVAREIDALIRRAGVVSCVAYQLRYGKTVQKAKEILAGRPIGLVIATRLGGLPGGPWWRVQSKSGGMLIEQHTHAVDIMRYLAGEIESVYAAADTRLLTDVPGVDIHDVNAATVRFASGAVGAIVNSCAVPQGRQLPLGNGLQFVARDVTVTIDFRETVAIWSDGRREVFPEEIDPNLRMNETFVKAVATGDRSGILSDYADGARTFEVTYATVLSAQRREIVRLGSGY